MPWIVARIDAIGAALLIGGISGLRNGNSGISAGGNDEYAYQTAESNATSAVHDTHNDTRGMNATRRSSALFWDISHSMVEETTSLFKTPYAKDTPQVTEPRVARAERDGTSEEPRAAKGKATATYSSGGRFRNVFTR